MLSLFKEKKSDIFPQKIALVFVVKNCHFFSSSSPTSENVHLLEFHPSLGLVGLIPKALEHLLLEARHAHKPASPSGLAQLEQHVLQLALDLWLTPARPEAWYSAQLQRDVGVFCQDSWVLGKENISFQMFLFSSVLLFGALPLYLAREKNTVTNLANIFMGFLVFDKASS